MAAVWLPALLAIDRLVRLVPLPAIASVLFGAVAAIAALCVAYQLRALVDPSFDPDVVARRRFRR
jgi:hypothetical protein